MSNHVNYNKIDLYAPRSNNNYRVDSNWKDAPVRVPVNYNSDEEFMRDLYEGKKKKKKKKDFFNYDYGYNPGYNQRPPMDPIDQRYTGNSGDYYDNIPPAYSDPLADYYNTGKKSKKKAYDDFHIYDEPYRYEHPMYTNNIQIDPIYQKAFMFIRDAITELEYGRLPEKDYLYLLEVCKSVGSMYDSHEETVKKPQQTVTPPVQKETPKVKPTNRAAEKLLKRDIDYDEFESDEIVELDPLFASVPKSAEPPKKTTSFQSMLQRESVPDEYEEEEEVEETTDDFYGNLSDLFDEEELEEEEHVAKLKDSINTLLRPKRPATPKRITAPVVKESKPEPQPEPVVVEEVKKEEPLESAFYIRYNTSLGRISLATQWATANVVETMPMPAPFCENVNIFKTFDEFKEYLHLYLLPSILANVHPYAITEKQVFLDGMKSVKEYDTTRFRFVERYYKEKPYVFWYHIQPEQELLLEKAFDAFSDIWSGDDEDPMNPSDGTLEALSYLGKCLFYQTTKTESSLTEDEIEEMLEDDVYRKEHLETMIRTFFTDSMTKCYSNGESGDSQVILESREEIEIAMMMFMNEMNTDDEEGAVSYAEINKSIQQYGPSGYLQKCIERQRRDVQQVAEETKPLQMQMPETKLSGFTDKITQMQQEAFEEEDEEEELEEDNIYDLYDDEDEDDTVIVEDDPLMIRPASKL